MTAVFYRVRAELRSRLRSSAVLALIVALGAGGAMTAAAGARRTDSSYRRFEQTHAAADVVVYPPFRPTFAQFSFSDIDRLPQVRLSARNFFFPTVEPLPQLETGSANFGTRIDRPKLLAGRMPAPTSLDEAAVVFTLAEKEHLRVGSRLTVHLSPPSGSKVVPVTLRVVGIEASPGEFPPQISNNNNQAVHVSRAFYVAWKPRVVTFEADLLDLRGGPSSLASFESSLHRLTHNGVVVFADLRDQAANVRRSFHLQAVALWIVAALFTLIVVLVMSQLLARQAMLDASEHGALHSVGMTGGQLWSVGMARSAAVAVGGALLGAAASIVASPVLPIGAARVAEPSPGIRLDGLVLGVGSAATVVLVLALAAWPVWTAALFARRGASLEAQGFERPALGGRLAARWGLPATVTAGVRMALEPGRGRTAVPVRSSLASVALAIGALAAAVTFGASLNHLLATPRQYGWNWDAYLSANADTNGPPPALARIEADPRVGSLAIVDTPPLAIGSSRFDGLVLKPEKGSIEPVVVEGRAPQRIGEVALGAKTMRDSGARVGSTVKLRVTAIASRLATLKVVGRVVIPPSSDTAHLGSGAVLPIDDYRLLAPPGFTPPQPTDAVLRFAPGVTRAVGVAWLERVAGQQYEVITPHKPADIVNFGQVQNLPLFLAGFIALLAMATLAHTLVTAIRRRRRDLAVHKTLGFLPSQVRAAVAWQATTFVSAAIVIGIPLGIVVGRLAWRIFADQLGTLPEPVIPPLPLLLMVPAAILVANFIAIAPGVMASRLQPAPVLRAE
jgi:ABC-type lipoprotein release transport system permease subunit